YTLEESLDFVSLNLKKDFPNLTNLNIKIFKPHIIKNATVGVKLKKKY
ncbi:dihydroneopterin aldolase, partial [Campylobacter jejuni]|nr:dihydroneopterin aldolase [Campylobacter jejuni]EAK3091664.1 dihydroneopterin aldolase [Campylobacter jejuni]EAK7500301.1 dihydroneopterin aldolase [Campylobacter jejuni]EAL4383302.1 dihydroneopterin aldolase [Campylobacter jejuni]EAM0282912.1 dihydroneopterin aldolase [Campylobacter jejuni]